MLLHSAYKSCAMIIKGIYCPGSDSNYNYAYSPRICTASIENSKICMSLYPYLKVILFFTIHHPIHYHKLYLIVD